jgi:carbon storage regulator CsrA
MLIFDRNCQESFKIGDEITIKVVEIQGMQVRLGITAPKGIVVVREELLHRNSGDRPSNNTPPRQKPRHTPPRVETKPEIERPAAAAKPAESKTKVTYKRRKLIMS